MTALRPVKGALGSKMFESAALEELEEDPPLEVLLPLVCSLAWLVSHLVVPLMMFWLEALLKSSQSDDS